MCYKSINISRAALLCGFQKKIHTLCITAVKSKTRLYIHWIWPQNLLTVANQSLGVTLGVSVFSTLAASSLVSLE